MSKNYKKLLYLLIPLLALFLLSLALGSAEEPCELCQLCKNKALVKEAIIAYDTIPRWVPPPHLFDPNYVQHGPTNDDEVSEKIIWVFGSHVDANFYYEPTFDFIIAEGDMVSVLVSWTYRPYQDPFAYDYHYTQLAIFRIANGKIIEGWIAPARYFKVWPWPEE